jgi:hypothetical protein
MKPKKFFCLINMCFLCFCSSCFDFDFCFAFAPCHHCCCYLMCYVIPCLPLLLIGMVFHSLHCVSIVCYDVWPSPYGTTTVYCGPSSFALCCCCLLWCIVLDLALLLFVVVHCPQPCAIVIYCGLSPSLYVTTIVCYGSSSFALCYCSML